MENNQILEALAQVPNLVEATKKVVECNATLMKQYSDLLAKRMEAEIPASEISKVTSAVANTRCAKPDLSDVAPAVASSVIRSLTSSMRETTSECIHKAFEDTPVKVEHIHAHTTLRHLTKMAEGALRNWIVGLACACGILICIVAGGCYEYFNSPAYLGRKYCDVCFSRYTTEDEREALKADCYSVSFVPREFKKNRKLIKEKIRRNEAILTQRQVEAEKNKGAWTTRTPLER